MILPPAVRRLPVPVAVAGSLLAVYALTLARDVTFWDAGEFIAAASSFGIPHPPGTPLYVLLLRAAVLAGAVFGIPAAIMTSAVSATCTAGACALGATLVARGTGDRAGAIAGGLAAGTMASVWLNASETEVYAAALALALAITWVAERAGRTGSLRWTMLASYLAVLTVPLHLSALLVAPAAVALAYRAGAGTRTAAAAPAVILGAAILSAYALGRATVGPAVVAAVALAVAGTVSLRWRNPSAPMAPAGVRDTGAVAARSALRALAPLVVVAIAASAVLVLLLRARHDPAVNQGDPATWPALLEVLSRRQYAVAALWPRQAPLWLQVGNLLLYADWQVALSLGPTIFPTPLRTAATVAFALLAVAGARAHFRRDRRTATAFALLLLAGTVGAALYLNLKAGPSFGHGILPPGAAREARERDYFFVLGWWAWGMWAGLGAVDLARRAGAPAAGLVMAALPLVLNWRAVDRTRLPEAALPRATAEGLLSPLPPRAVLFVAGDNDSYPLWYAQRTLGLRRDVTVVTTPLLPADWYRAELARRDALFAGGADDRRPWQGREAAIREIASRAKALGRPVAMATAMSAGDRALVGAGWTLVAAAYVADTTRGVPSVAARVDTGAAQRWEARLRELGGDGAAHPSTDGTARYMRALLGCPGVALRNHREGVVHAISDSLARYCNLR